MRKNKLIKLGGLLLATMFMFSVVSCQDTAEDNSQSDATRQSQDYQGPGIHENNTKPTDSYILQNGKSDYKIVVPADSYEYEEKAADLLQTYLSAATGYVFPVVEDSDVSASYSKVISVGDTVFMRNSGIPVEFSELDHSGYKIVTQGDRIFISGARSSTREGTYYGAQDFLEETIGWRAYTADDVVYNKVSALKMYDFDITEVPDFKFRNLVYGNVRNNETWLDYARLTNNSDAWLPLDGHSHMELVPPETYYALHPEWYMYNGDYDGVSRDIYYKGQICMSNAALLDEAANNLAAMFKNHPAASYAHIGIMDNANFCDCDGCEDMIEEYDTNYGGQMIIWTNMLSRKTMEIVHATEPDREMYFEVYCYKHTLKAPVYSDHDGNITPHHDAVVPDDNIMIMFTPLEYNAYDTIEDELNDDITKKFQEWVKLSNHMTFYQYSSNFDNYAVNYPQWNTVVSNLRYYADNGVEVITDQGGGSQQVAMIELRIYVESRIMWDLSLSWKELATEFIEYFYGPVADDVQRMYDTMTAYFTYARECLGLTGSVYIDLDTKDFWEFSYVESIRKIMTGALNKLETIKDSDPETYNKYYYRVASAYMDNMWIQLEVYMSEYSKDHISEIIDLFEETAAYYGAEMLAENRDMVSQKIATWRDQNV